MTLSASERLERIYRLEQEIGLAQTKLEELKYQLAFYSQRKFQLEFTIKVLKKEGEK